MLTDPNFRTTFIPLLLRLTLGAIFIYHGLVKVSPRSGNDWGAAWATNLQMRAAQPSPEALAALHDRRAKLEARLNELKDKGAKEEDLEDAETRLDGLKSTEAEMKLAYAGSSNLPEALSYAGIQLAVAWGELLCGLALLVGLLTRLASAVIILIMIGAIYTMTQAHIFTQVTGAGVEYNLAIAVMAIVLIIKGAGPLSLDSWLEQRRKAVVHARPPQPVGV